MKAMNSKTALVIALTASLVACAKKGALEFNDSSSSIGTSSLCVDPSSSGSPTPLRRLSKRELSNSLLDLLGSSIHTAVASAIAVIPNDEQGVKFDHVGNTLSFSHIESLFSLAEQVSEEIVTRQPSFYNISTCLTAADDSTCIRGFITSFGYRVFRRPLSSVEVLDYLTRYESQRTSSRTDAVKILIASLLQSSNFYYITELRGTSVNGLETELQLSPYEIATRLSFSLTGSTPDDALLTEAANSALATAAGLEAQVKRLMSSTKGRAHIKEYVTQLLHLDSLPALNQSSFFLNGQSTSGLSAQMVQETQDYMLYHLLDSKKTFAEMMTSRTSFVKGTQLAQLYGIAPSALASGEVTLPPERTGLLTRAALLASGEDNHAPFHRGQVLSSEFVCATVGRPDPNLVPEAFATIQNVADITTRAHLESLTSPTTCMGCHSVLNSFGFALENFDSIGRFRTNEIKYSTTGQVLKTLPIDSSVSPQIDGTEIGISGADDLARKLAVSSQAKNCFSRKWFRFSMAKKENVRSDGCAIQKMSDTLNDQNQGLSGMISQVFKLKEFKMRVAPSN
jgi:hypothetical protein